MDRDSTVFYHVCARARAALSTLGTCAIAAPLAVNFLPFTFSKLHSGTQSPKHSEQGNRHSGQMAAAAHRTCRAATKHGCTVQPVWSPHCGVQCGTAAGYFSQSWCTHGMKLDSQQHIVSDRMTRLVKPALHRVHCAFQQGHLPGCCAAYTVLRSLRHGAAPLVTHSVLGQQRQSI